MIKYLHIDYMGKRRLWFAISGVVILISVVSLATRGLNLGIDFRGGVQITFKTSKPTSLTLVRQQTDAIGRSDAVVQGRGKSTNGDEYSSFQIRLKKLTTQQQNKLQNDLTTKVNAVAPGSQERVVELRQADRALRDHRRPLLPARDHALHRGALQGHRVRRAGDRRADPRRRDHDRGLLGDGARGDGVDGGGDPDRARLLDLRHDHHLRPHPREHPDHAARVVRHDRERLAVGDDPPLAGDDVHHPAAGRSRCSSSAARR